METFTNKIRLDDGYAEAVVTLDTCSYHDGAEHYGMTDASHDIFYDGLVLITPHLFITIKEVIGTDITDRYPGGLEAGFSLMLGVSPDEIEFGTPVDMTIIHIGNASLSHNGRELDGDEAVQLIIQLNHDLNQIFRRDTVFRDGTLTLHRLED